MPIVGGVIGGLIARWLQTAPAGEWGNRQLPRSTATNLCRARAQVPILTIGQAMSGNSSSQGPKTVTAVKTAVFKLHNPTQRKRAMLDRALLHNHLAYTKALKAAMPLSKTFVETELQSRVTDKELTARERSTQVRLRKWERAAILKKRIRSAIGGIRGPLAACPAASSVKSKVILSCMRRMPP